MKTKITISFFILLIFGQPGLGQTDSTDLVFTHVLYEHQSLEDSLTYGIGELSQMHLEFEIDDLVHFGKVWVEVFAVNAGANAVPVFFDSYSVSELTNAGFLEESQADIGLMIVDPVGTYYAVIRIEDSYGHEKISITKYLEE